MFVLHVTYQFMDDMIQFMDHEELIRKHMEAYDCITHVFEPIFFSDEARVKMNFKEIFSLKLCFEFETTKPEDQMKDEIGEALMGALGAQDEPGYIRMGRISCPTCEDCPNDVYTYVAFAGCDCPCINSRVKLSEMPK